MPWPAGGPPGRHPPPAGAGAPRPSRAPVPHPAGSRRQRSDPPTDPIGLPPVRTPAAPRPAGPDHTDAAALAAAFALDYLSWDEDDPARRGRVLADYLLAPGANPGRLGWSGEGRQRAELALPGLTRADGEHRVLVDVRVRVTPYRAVGEHADAAAAEPEPAGAGVPAVAPAPTARGWRSLASNWVRISVPIVLEGGRLAVDAWEETLGGQPTPAGSQHPREDPLAGPDGAEATTLRPDGAW